jgi:hypothetical protein
MTTNSNSTKIITGKVRFSYVNVFEPRAVNEGDDPKYSVCILVSKKDEATLSKIDRAIKAAYVEGKNIFKGKSLESLKTPLRDGDVEKPEDEAFAGMYFFNANANPGFKPNVVKVTNGKIEPIHLMEEFYSGCYGLASVTFYPFPKNGLGPQKGIAAGLNNLMKLEDGEKLSGGASAEEDFKDVDLSKYNYDDDPLLQ